MQAPVEMPPYVHSDHATCIRDFEGSFAERRRRLHVRLVKARAVTKMDLIQRNIVQGVNVVRRGAYSLEGLLQRRPPLESMLAVGKLPRNYIDLLFPSNPADSVAPLAERKQRVRLDRLLVRSQLDAPPGMPPLNWPVSTEMLASMLAQMSMMPPDQHAPPMPNLLGMSFDGICPPMAPNQRPGMQPPLYARPPLGPFMPPGMPMMMPDVRSYTAPHLAGPAHAFAGDASMPPPAAVRCGDARAPAPPALHSRLTSPALPSQPPSPASVSQATCPQADAGRQEAPPAQPAIAAAAAAEPPPALPRPPFVQLIEEFCERSLAREVHRGRRRRADSNLSAFSADVGLPLRK